MSLRGIIVDVDHRGESLGFAVSIGHAKVLIDGGGTIPAAVSVAQETYNGTQHQPQERKKSLRQELREKGTVELDRDVKTLAAKADEVDDLYKKYTRYCAGQTSSGYAYGRDWFGYWSAPVAIDNESLPECSAMLDDILRIAAEIKSGMLFSLERARKAGVYPGDRRKIRRKYGMDWPGWEK